MKQEDEVVVEEEDEEVLTPAERPRGLKQTHGAVDCRRVATVLTPAERPRGLKRFEVLILSVHFLCSYPCRKASGIETWAMFSQARTGGVVLTPAERPRGLKLSLLSPRFFSPFPFLPLPKGLGD